MDFSNYNNFYAQHASPSGRTPAPTNYTHNFYRHKTCSYCSNPCHSFSNCPSWGQFCNPSYEQMNTNFSSLRFDSNSNVYNPDWSNHSDFLWQAQVAGNCAPEYHELHRPEYPQFNHQSSPPSSYNYPAQELSLEDTIKAYTQKMKQSIQELRNVQANFSNSRFDSNFSFYNSDWSNHSDFSWQDQATGNYAPPHNELHYPEYPQFKNQVLNLSSYDPLPQRSSLEDALKEFMERTGKSTIQVPQPELSLEDTVKAFIQASSQNIQELKSVTTSNN
jgi:hypothetical protein